MKIQKLEIHLATPQPVYYAGQTISGSVHLELIGELDFKAITLTVHGTADVHWSEQHGSGKSRNTVQYRNKETYLDLKIFLVGDGKDKTKLPIGTHSFPFAITLPPNLPSTFMGAHGRVLYWLKCNIDRPWKVDKNLHLYVTVISLLDLNMDPNSVLPITNSGAKTFGCMCCKTGPLTANISLPKVGFVCGETILFSATIENNSDKVMTKSSVKLVENDVFKAHSGAQKHVKRVILQHQQASIAPGDSFNWSNVGLLIPPLAPSNLIHCNIIDIFYTVELSVDPSGIGFDLDVPCNITIGTIPLQQQYGQIAGPSSEGSAPPPPSYSEAVHGKEEIQLHEGVSVQGGGWYAPHYPTYTFNPVEVPQ